ncbi:DoxX family membrane protein [Frankia sp. AgPm24]|uniref:MauE/DoxX family redox-associated membrane protein n=1 Tax=Frankia sp. AgPm24 TaxID=631128 RepID=UPI00200C7849|nr:MauE/DoxX family redox-associated membrane protein [Frankia sp. AgPm24]MCK9920898.1 DoxX family membrane protein [Frankia sp. AgPm24]
MFTIAHRLRAPSQPASRVVSTALRLVLGAVWLAAGLLKINDPDGMLRSVRAFRILPESLVQPVAYGVPFLEIALGVLLVLGLAVRVSAVVSALMFATYIAAIASAAARGLRIDCGCFSSGGDLGADAPTHYTSELVRDSLLLLVALVLVWRPTGYLAVDRLLDRPVDLDTSHDPNQDESALGDPSQGDPSLGDASPDEAGSGEGATSTADHRRSDVDGFESLKK